MEVAMSQAKLTHRLATPADQDFLLRLFKDVHADEFAALQMPQAALDGLLDMQFRAQRAGYAARFSRVETRIYCLAQQRVGYAVVDRRPGVLHLVDLALFMRSRGQGTGSLILSALAQEADAEQLAMELQVRLESRARDLYKRHGFEETGRDELAATMVRSPGYLVVNK